MSRITEHSPTPPDAFVAPTDNAEVARIEAANAIRQFDAGLAMIETALAGGGKFRLRPSHVYALNAVAIKGLSPTPGVQRTGAVWINNSVHLPPPAPEVQRFVEEFCDYVDDHWDRPAIHLAAYLLWRVNWYTRSLTATVGRLG